MVNKLLKGIFKVVIGLVTTIMSPIENLIDTYVPQLNDIFGLFSDFLNYVSGFIFWVLSWFHIPRAIFLGVIAIIIAKLTIGKLVHVVKLALAWWRTLIP